jgi:hypothetical protein
MTKGGSLPARLRREWEIRNLECEMGDHEVPPANDSTDRRPNPHQAPHS